jgi:hypothetical protein
MSDEPPEKPTGRLGALPKYMWFVLVAVFIVIVWIFFSRWDADRQIKQRALERQREENRRTVELLGGNRFEILQFYASPGAIRRGEKAQVCYGVSNAKVVRIAPRPASGVWPSLSRCVEVAPTKDTTYTLTIEDGKGNTKTATVDVKVSSKNAR